MWLLNQSQIFLPDFEAEEERLRIAYEYIFLIWLLC